MSSIRKQMMLAAATAACAAASPIQAVPEAQSIFVKLAQREAPAAMQPALRAEALPALALLPAGADAVFVAAQAGKSAVELMRLMDCKCKDGEAQLGSIGSLAMSAGGGSAGEFERALPAMVYAAQLGSLEQWEKRWRDHAKPEFADAIHRGFQPQKELIRKNLQSVLADCHPKPVYVALTAAPGKEADFQNLCRCIQQAMRRATEDGKWQPVEVEGYSAGIRTTQLHVWNQLMDGEPDSAELKSHLAQRELYLMMRVQEGALLVSLCENPGDIVLPQNADSSLLHSPLLAGADAHMPQLRAAAWLSPVFFRVLQKCLYAEKNPLTLAMADSFRNIGQVDAAHQNVYLNATRDALLLDSPPEGDIPQISRPFEMQVWQPAPNALRAHSSLDAWGARFEPGELRLAAQASSPGMIYYAESTPLTSPYMPHRDGVWKALVGVGHALLLTLRDETRNSLLPWVHGAEALAPEAVALEGALQTMGSALGAPLAIVSGDGAPGEDPAVAVSAVLKSRSGLAAGWQQMLQTLGQVASKFGLSPAVVTELPVQSRALGNDSVQHSLHLPFLPKEMHPGVALSDHYFVLGYSPALNERLLAAASVSANRVPFSGAVCAFSFPGWAKTARTMTDRAGDKPGTALSITRFLERLSAKAELLLHSTTIQDGAVESGCAIKLKD